MNDYEPWVKIAVDSAGRRRRGSENRGSVVPVVVVVVVVVAVDRNRIRAGRCWVFIYTLLVVRREEK